MNNIPSVLVAAGASRRMGQPKQLLPWNHHTLIEHQVNTLLTSSQEVYVILGAYADQIRPLKIIRLTLFSVKIGKKEWEILCLLE